ncbi:hydrolase 1, exosortase A system-associated [Paucibacter sp. AS339]|uniref:hydrolase 1, exosortase A system-associated n=1 Tax=Paucibacter hankyongi TaxID=3133434 RepID=UPI0030AF1A94
MNAHQAAGNPDTASAIETRPLRFACEGESLLGMLTLPQDRIVERALLMITGGPQYRVGSHRLYLQLGRWLAGHGVAVLRFDFRGAGDSTGQPRPFTEHQADIAAGLQALKTELGENLKDIGLFGLCDGASAALMYCYAHPSADIQRLILINPWVRSPETHAKVQLKHYYLQRFRSADFWSRLFTGKVDPQTLPAILGQLALMVRSRISAVTATADSTPRGDSIASNYGFQKQMQQGLLTFKGPVCLILSEHDFTAAEFREACTGNRQWRRATQAPQVRVQTLMGADHTFSGDQAKCSLRESLVNFMAPRSKFNADRDASPAPSNAGGTSQKPSDCNLNESVITPTNAPSRYE